MTNRSHHFLGIFAIRNVRKMWLQRGGLALCIALGVWTGAADAGWSGEATAAHRRSAVPAALIYALSSAPLGFVQWSTSIEMKTSLLIGVLAAFALALPAGCKQEGPVE